jgi:4-carboxymuconolactone decarboxylase
MDDAERARQGMTVRRAVLGNAHVDRAVAATTSFTEPFQDLITRYAWGEIWSRPGLSRSERSIVTLAVLAALQHENELAMHVKAALRNGLSPEQIQEVLLQVTLYAGVPVGNRAFAVAQRALAEAAEDELPPDRRSRSGFTGPVAVTSLSLAIASLAAKLASCHSPSSDRRTSVLMAIGEAVSFC